MENFHFIYPTWLLLLIPFSLVILWLLRQQYQRNTLQQLVDPQLAPFVLTGQHTKPSYHLFTVITVLGLIAILAMAGPSWQKRKQAAFKKQQALVIALDLSTSMYAKDSQPNRLVRARFELIDLLKQRKEGQTALLVYAGDAFVVSPLTTDAETIESQAKLLSPDIMPTQGSRTAVAIYKALQLLEQTKVKEGHILLISDEIVDQAAAIEAANKAKARNIQVSVLAIGTTEGSPIPLPQGSFIKDAAGNIVLAKINPVAMQKLALAGGGIFVQSVVSDQDLNQLARQFANGSALLKKTQTELSTWINEGIWLLFLLIPIALLAFRKGYLASVTFFIMLLVPQPKPLMAFTWDDLWETTDQQGQQAFQQGQSKQAAQLFSNPQWKASAAYKAGDYSTALQQFSMDKSTEGLYNTANTLVKLNKIPEAIAAYEQVLQHDKQHADAKYNLELLKKQQQQQESTQKQPQDKQQDAKQNGKPQNQNQQQQGKQDKPQDSAQKQASEQQQSNQDEQSQAGQDAAEKQALEEWNKQNPKPKQEQAPEDNQTQAGTEEQTQQKREQQQATEQWLRRIPDDPTGLWRRKFQYQYKRQNSPQNTGQNW